MSQKVAAEVDSTVAVDHWKGALKKGRPIWVCNGWKVLMKKKVGRIFPV
jgi:hypothetical protein